MLKEQHRAGLWLAVCLGLVSGPARAAEENVVTRQMPPLCVNQDFWGSWYNQGFDSPYLIELEPSTRDCGTRANIWESQANGSLWQRGGFDGHFERLDDGSEWFAVDPVPVGGYVAHHWLLLDTSNGRRLRVWTYYESLDSKPDAFEDHWYRPSAPGYSDGLTLEDQTIADVLKVTSGTNAADPVIHTIDDFTTNPFQRVMPSLSAGWATDYQSAPTALGGIRQTNVIADDTLSTSSSIDIENGSLTVSSGLGSYFGAYLGYGYDAEGNSSNMVGDFDGYEYFQIDFERSDLGLVYLVEVVDGDGTLALVADTLTSEAQSAPYSARLPLAQFEGTDTQGNPQAIQWDDIRYLIVLFQSANDSGGNNFSVTSITAVDAD